MRLTKFPATISRAMYHPAAGYIVLIASFAVTALAWRVSLEYAERRASDKFSFQVKQVESAILERMNQYARLLRAGVALHDASVRVDREEWREFVATLDLNNNYPGTQGIGISVLLRPDELGSHMRSVRAEGFPDYSVRPAGTRDLYSSIVYLEPFDWRNQRAFGYDMYSEKMRRAAMDRAMATGLPSISGNVTLVQETDADVQTGFLMYLPIQAEAPDEGAVSSEPIARTKAFVYAVLRGGDLMRNILAGIGDDLSLRISDPDGGSGSVLFESRNTDESFANAALSESRIIDIYGHQWTVLVRQHSGQLSSWEYWRSTLVGILGLLVNFWLFYTIRLIGLQRRAMEQQRLTDNLEKANAKLTQANSSFERSNRDLASFAYSASHDMKSPLRAICNLAGFIKADSEGSLSEKSLKHLDLLLQRTKRLDQLLDDMLAYASIDANTEQTDEIHLATLCKSVAGMIDIPAGFKVSIDTEVPLLKSSSTPLRQLLMNLVSNAIKHHDRETGSIDIRARWVAGRVEFVVSDDGPGIPKQHRHKVFEMFSTLQSRDKREGSGMGLAFVKRLIESNGGEIQIRGNDDTDRGTNVHFTWCCEAVGAPEGVELISNVQVVGEPLNDAAEPDRRREHSTQ